MVLVALFEKWTDNNNRKFYKTNQRKNQIMTVRVPYYGIKYIIQSDVLFIIMGIIVLMPFWYWIHYFDDDYSDSYFIADKLSSNFHNNVFVESSKKQQQPLIRFTLLEQIPDISTDLIWSSICKEGGNIINLMESSSSKASPSSLSNDTNYEEVADDDVNDDDNNNQFKVSIVEVGGSADSTMQQCIESAQLGLLSHCIEPSPHIHNQILSNVRQESSNVQRLMKLYQNVASDKLNINVTINDSGGGETTEDDHVGTYNDEDNMKKIVNFDSSNEHVDVVNVTTIRVDDIVLKYTIQNNEQFIGVKVHTYNGNETNVLFGMMNSIQEYAISFILIEFFRPTKQQIDLSSSNHVLQQQNDHKSCWEISNILQLLIEYNYTLYALPISSYHSLSSSRRNATSEVSIDDEYNNIQNKVRKVQQRSQQQKQLIRKKQLQHNPDEVTIIKKQDNSIVSSLPPIYTLYDYCLWSNMGYWSDVLVVSPSVKDPALSLYYRQRQEEESENNTTTTSWSSSSVESILHNPITNVGKVLKDDLGIL